MTITGKNILPFQKELNQINSELNDIKKHSVNRSQILTNEVNQLQERVLILETKLDRLLNTLNNL